MNMKFVLTVIATLFVMVTAWKVSQDNAPQTEVQRSEFLPELLASANDVDALTIRNSDNETRLERQGENWVISNKDGYPAKIADIRKTLLQLARLISVEAKTSRPEQHGRIGLLTPASGDGAGTLVRASAEDNELVSLIIGNSRNAGSQQQHYIRRTAEDQSWLVAGELESAISIPNAYAA